MRIAPDCIHSYDKAEHGLSKTEWCPREYVLVHTKTLTPNSQQTNTITLSVTVAIANIFENVDLVIMNKTTFLVAVFLIHFKRTAVLYNEAIFVQYTGLILIIYF